MNLFARVEAEFLRRRRDGGLERSFQRWVRDEGALTQAGSLETVLKTCRNPDGSMSVKDALLVDLCGRAKAGDQDAKLVLVWLMLPGLLRLRTAMPRQIEGLESDQIDADVLLGFWTGVAASSVGTTRVAARLLTAARHEAYESIRKHITWVERAELFDQPPEDPAGSTDPTFDAVVRATVPGIDELLERALRDDVLTPLQVDLVGASRSEMRSIRARWGLTVGEASCRRNRATARLVRWFKEQSPNREAGL